MRGNHRKVTRRHAAPASRSRRIVRRAAVAVAIAAGLAGYGLSGASAATVHHATRRQIMAACEHGETMGIDGHTYVCTQVLIYSGSQQRCERWQAGLLAIVMAPRRPFVAQCDPDGRGYVWDAWR